MEELCYNNATPVDLDFSPADNWKLFKQKWKNYATITQLQKQSTDYQVALLLHTIADAALKIYNGFTFETEEDSRSVDEILAKFDSFAVGETNECCERFVSHNRNQQHSETFETATRVLIKSCDFCDACRKSTLRDRIILGVYDREVQEALLKQSNIARDDNRYVQSCRTCKVTK